MWAFLALALALTVRASDTNNDTAAEEKLVIARGKLLVSTYRNVNFIFVALVQKSEIKSTHEKRTGGIVTALNEQMGK